MESRVLIVCDVGGRSHTKDTCFFSTPVCHKCLSDQHDTDKCTETKKDAKRLTYKRRNAQREIAKSSSTPGKTGATGSPTQAKIATPKATGGSGQIDVDTLVTTVTDKVTSNVNDKLQEVTTQLASITKFIDQLSQTQAAKVGSAQSPSDHSNFLSGAGEVGVSTGASSASGILASNTCNANVGGRNLTRSQVLPV